MYRRLALIAAALVVAAGFALPGASASRNMQVGIYDDSTILGNPNEAFPLLRQLRAEIIRVTIWWGGRPGGLSVARRRPEEPTNPADPAYNWAVYDDVITRAAEGNMRVLLSILGTPGWANGGKRFNRAPTSGATLRAFAYAAATRYSGSFTPEGAEQPLPAVRFWLAWNEPNDPVFLSPQYRRVKGRWVMQSPRDYARICNAVVAGVHSTMLRNEKIGCGVTSPRGNNKPGSRRPSIAPLTFLQAMKQAGARGFDAYAHHPYYGNPSESPAKRPSSGITLANIGTLTKQVVRLYGRKRIWVTEYGYQTKPPDPLFGVTWSAQARYLAQAFSIARRNPAIDMMIWFLIRDEPRARGRDGWQSGLMTKGGRRKPSFGTFRRLPH